MSLANVNARQLSNGAIFVQYQQDGKTKDAAFMSWAEFVSWLRAEVVDPDLRDAAIDLAIAKLNRENEEEIKD